MHACACVGANYSSCSANLPPLLSPADVAFIKAVDDLENLYTVQTEEQFSMAIIVCSILLIVEVLYVFTSLRL